MKCFYIVCLSLFSINLMAQSRIAKIDSKVYNDNIKSQENRVSETKEAQGLIKKLELKSVEVGSTTLPIVFTNCAKKLTLNGAGVRKMMWADLYACGLYLREQNNNPLKIVSVNRTMAIRIDIVSNTISQKKLIKSFQQGFEKANLPQAFKIHKPEFDQFITFFDTKVKIGDTYDIVYIPGKGTSLFINNKIKGTVTGLSFKSAIFNIWLSNTAVDGPLKNRLIGNNN